MKIIRDQTFDQNEVYKMADGNEKKPEYFCFQDLGGGKLIQQVKGGDVPLFAFYDGDISKIELKPVITFDGIDYLPHDGKEVEFMSLASDAVEPPPVSELAERLCSWSEKYLDIPSDFRKFSAYFTIFTWLHDLCNTTPYLRFLGDTGCGKSRGLDVFGKLSYNYLPVSGATTVSPIFRLIPKWNPTLGFEEADFRKTDETSDLTKLINVGFERGKPILRSNTENPNKIEAFDVFCPKIFATRHEFQDPATESRCLTTRMEETEREDISAVLPISFYSEAEKFRNQLLGFRFQNYYSFKPGDENDFPSGLEPRIRQMAFPLLAIFTENEDKQEFFRFLIDYQIRIRETRLNSFAGQCLLRVKELADEKGDGDSITSKEIAEDLKASTYSITKELKVFGFIIEQRRVQIAKQDEFSENKSKNVRALTIAEASWRRVNRRYGLNAPVRPTSLIPKSQVLKQKELTEFGGNLSLSAADTTNTPVTEEKGDGKVDTVTHLANKELPDPVATVTDVTQERG